MKIVAKELQYNRHGIAYEDGYRIVYFYDDNNYEIGEYIMPNEQVNFIDYDKIIEDMPKELNHTIQNMYK